MRHPVYFVTDGVTYTITYVQDYQDNFAEVVPRTSRVVGTSGGFDSHGNDPAPAEIGNVQCQCVLTVTTLSDMTNKQDTLRALSRKPKGTLFFEMEDGTLRYCKARVNSIQTPQSETTHSEVWTKARIAWQVADPHFYTIGTETPNWGEFVWGDEIEEPVDNVVSGTSTDFTITIGGTVQTLPRIVIVCGTGETAENVTIQRLVDDEVVEEITFTDVLTDGDSVEIDCNAKSVTKNGSDAYADFSFDGHFDWIRLQPGDNDIRVTMENVGDDATVTFYYEEVYV